MFCLKMIYILYQNDKRYRHCRILLFFFLLTYSEVYYTSILRIYIYVLGMFKLHLKCYFCKSCEDLYSFKKKKQYLHCCYELGLTVYKHRCHCVMPANTTLKRILPQKCLAQVISCHENCVREKEVIQESFCRGRQKIIRYNILLKGRRPYLLSIPVCMAGTGTQKKPLKNTSLV